MREGKVKMLNDENRITEKENQKQQLYRYKNKCIK